MPRETQFVTVVVEGVGDEPVARRLLDAVGLEAGPMHSAGGTPKLDSRLASYNHAARLAPWLVLRDLDNAPCAPGLLTDLLPTPAPFMCFRLAVRAAEAWLMADREAIAAFLGVALHLIPADPDEVERPKRRMVDIARRSRQQSVMRDMVPAAGTTAEVGPAYVSRITEFARIHWRPRHAARNSKSLRACIAALERLRDDTVTAPRRRRS